MKRLLLMFVLRWGLQAAPLGDPALQEYFTVKARALATNCLAGVESRADWERLRPQYQEQLREMLGLAPLPARTELHATITGRVEREEVVVEKLHFQSMPGLYVTGNLYLPRVVAKPLPTILYLCGHGPVKTNGISYGNKVAYQHHGAWFARHGYACLILDTIQLGEIEGVHHGTYREGMWWWNGRGYTPAGVEAWNGMRALDYLETRPEIDKTRFGATGRSGGGAYSWWISALDERIKVAAPVAGLTDLENQVVDGVVDGHCDCMFFVNTYRWDYPMVAALVAPRPLLIGNSDKDAIFPLDGVLRSHAKAKQVYDLYGASDKLGLLITEGPHKDTQDLQLPVFRWFNRQLKGEDPVISRAATKLFTPGELKVFERLPEEERTSHIHDTFLPREAVMELKELRPRLRARTFAAWPTEMVPEARSPEKAWGGKGEIRRVELATEKGAALNLYYVPRENATGVRLQIIRPGDLAAWRGAVERAIGVKLERGEDESVTDSSALDLMVRNLSDRNSIAAFLVVRKGGEPSGSETTRIRRRHMLLGETLESARVWDIGQGVRFLGAQPMFKGLPIHLSAEGLDAANLLIYAALAEPPPASLTLVNLPDDPSRGPDYLNFERFTDLQQVLRMVRAEIKAVSVEVAKLP